MSVRAFVTAVSLVALICTAVMLLPAQKKPPPLLPSNTDDCKCDSATVEPLRPPELNEPEGPPGPAWSPDRRHDEPPLMNPSGHRRRGHFGGPDHRKQVTGQYGWKFVRYIPSELEERWAEDVKPFARSEDWVPLQKKYQKDTGRLVELGLNVVTPHVAFNESDFQKIHEECVRYIGHLGKESSAGTGKTCLDSANEVLDPSFFSRFEYEFGCLGEPCNPAHARHLPQFGKKHTSYIEPLFGNLRHPLNFLQGINPKHKVHFYLANKSYMIVDKWALNHLGTRWKEKTRRSFFFDMGASTYSTGRGGASQDWFFGLSECLCVPFTESFLWEATPIDPKTFWVKVPPTLHPHYHWFNYPLDVEPDSWRNPLNHFLEKVNDGDAVMMKIDFDSPKIEMGIIELIIQHPSVHQHIDELFFEDHVAMSWMSRFWLINTTTNPRTVVDSLSIFRRLRELGIRAHSWV